ncbi:choice-of-anchor D domain-containing protein, partial [Pontivivens nitratireducens]|uniref:choice-of-anchor D domain-containing protein n=1 Tax=Pontivivens nitratireducens TaxID=2758038 RepID=UPI001C8D5851
MIYADRLAILKTAANWCRHVSGVRMSFILSVLFSTILGFMLMLGSPQAAHAAITDCTNMVSPNEYALNLIQDTCMINTAVPVEDQTSDEFLFIQPVYDTGNANFRYVSNANNLFYHVSSASGSGTVGGSTWVVTLDCNAGCTVSPVSGASFVPFTYTFSGTTGSMSGGAAPELDVRNSADNADIGDGSTTITTALGTDFGTVTVGSTATNSFRAENNGTSALTFGTDALAISNTTDFQITADLTNSGTVASSGVNTFSIRFNPATGGTKTSTVTIRSDDDDEDPYTFSIRGTGNSLPAAEAGSNAVVDSGNDVMLDSAGSVANDAGQTLTYAWAQTAGPAV